MRSDKLRFINPMFERERVEIKNHSKKYSNTQKNFERSEVSTITFLDVIVLTDGILKKFSQKNKKINKKWEK